MQQQTQTSNPGSAPSPEAGQQIAENPNPRANENIKHTPFEEKRETEPGNDVGTEITDGEGG
jgi:hypothetical protein